MRIGNQAVREAQARNRELGIPNWYSLNGRLVSDAEPKPVNHENASEEPAWHPKATDAV
ncbi:hypothetical protein [Sphaerotilus sp.]|uniref:hypothetical protein n=1 Tax=Sphaerotilus sp. TaxID=2093942 RepID=UPI0034E1C44D